MLRTTRSSRFGAVRRPDVDRRGAGGRQDSVLTGGPPPRRGASSAQPPCPRRARGAAGRSSLHHLGVPRIVAGYNSYFRIVQTRDFVVLFSEVIHDARIIPLDGRAHLPQTIRQWHGDSRGRWDGDTFVVETTNFSRGSYFLGSSDNLHLTEQLTRFAEGTIVYEVTARDLSTWTEPWIAEVHLKRSKDPIFEFACHEGNSRSCRAC